MRVRNDLNNILPRPKKCSILRTSLSYSSYHIDGPSTKFVTVDIGQYTITREVWVGYILQTMIFNLLVEHYSF
jgi:hypothetical protein